MPSTLLYCLVCELTGRFRYCVAGHALFNLLSLPGTAWADSDLEKLLWGASLPVGVLFLTSVTVLIALACAFRDRLFGPGARSGEQGS